MKKTSLQSAKIRLEFPLLQNGEMIYLDSAATTQKPLAVLDAMQMYYATSNANVHRGLHGLAEKATIAYESARERVATFLNAKTHEIIFTKSATEGVNLVARSLGESLQEQDTIALTLLEHHSNIVPWQQVQERNGVNIEWVGICSNGSLDMDALHNILQKKPALLAITGLSNVLGTRTSLKHIIENAHAVGTKVIVDAAQLVAHVPIDVEDLDCDFLVCSGHKLYGPTGIGVLYGKREHLESMPPFLGGGSMIQEVTTMGFSPAGIPSKFEAGTPPIAEAIGLHAAIDWITQYDWTLIQEHEQALLNIATQQLQSLDGCTILGSNNAEQDSLSPPATGCVSFVLEGIHPHDLTDILGQKHICLRAGHHCAQPLHEYFGVPASTRLSLGIYNTQEDIENTIAAIREVQMML